MAFFSTAASKPILIFLLVATIPLVLLSSSHNSIAQARVERELFVLQLVKALANGAARIGHNMLWKASEKTILKFFGAEAKKGSEFGEKVFEFIDKMKDIATQQCNTTFCVTLDLKCEPCSSDSPFSVSCDPYCVLKWVDNNTLSCLLPCGPPGDDDGGACLSKSFSLREVLSKVYMLFLFLVLYYFICVVK